MTLDVSSGGASISGTGTFEDTENGTIITRDISQTRFYIAAANWQSITVTYPDGSGLDMIDTITKQSAATVGVLTRFSNRDVRINLPSTARFTVNVVYSGKSSGIIYTIQP